VRGADDLVFLKRCLHGDPERTDAGIQQKHSDHGDGAPRAAERATNCADTPDEQIPRIIVATNWFAELERMLPDK